MPQLLGTQVKLSEKKKKKKKKTSGYETTKRKEHENTAHTQLLTAAEKRVGKAER